MGGIISLVAELVSFEKTKLKQAFNLIGCAINDNSRLILNFLALTN